jgi:hypothetical protein
MACGPPQEGGVRGYRRELIIRPKFPTGASSECPANLGRQSAASRSSRPTKNTIAGPISFSLDHYEETVYVPRNAGILILPVTRKRPGVLARRKGT